jgi:hypothetical protein
LKDVWFLLEDFFEDFNIWAQWPQIFEKEKKKFTITLAFLPLRVFLWPIFTTILWEMSFLEKKYSVTNPLFFFKGKICQNSID